MKAYTYEWKDGTLSIGVAESKDEAIKALQKVGDVCPQCDTENLTEITLDSFFVTFGLKAIPDGLGLTVSEIPNGIEDIIHDWADKVTL